jgi:hypothetical protein
MIRTSLLNPKRANPTRGTAQRHAHWIVAGCFRIGAGNAASKPGLVDKFRDRDIAATARPRSIETRGKPAKSLEAPAAEPKAASAALRSIKLRRLDDAGQP